MLTDRQQEILKFITKYTEANGFPPSVRDIGKYFGIYPATVQDHIQALERKGYLRKRPLQSRTLTLAPPHRRVAGSSVPIVGRVAAGAPILAAENIENVIELPKGWAAPGAFLLKVRGNSMEGAHILDGDYVLVHPQQTAANGDVVVALIGEDATVKRFYRNRERILLKPENPRFEPIEVQDTGDRSVRLIGRVVGVLRVMKK